MMPSTAISIGVGLVIFFILLAFRQNAEWAMMIGWIVGALGYGFYLKRKETKRAGK